MTGTWRCVRRWRKASVVDLVEHLTTPVDNAGVARRDPPVEAVRLLGRLLAGFRDPLWESALLAAVLRRQGHRADLVIGYEPVPGAQGRRLVPWVEIGGVPVDRDDPPATFCPELVRFPSDRGVPA